LQILCIERLFSPASLQKIVTVKTRTGKKQLEEKTKNS